MYNTEKRRKIRDAIFPTIYEYILIVFPIIIYVGLESMHKGKIYLLKSPEWAIASIFLSFQGTALYIRSLNRGRRINNDFLGILLLIVIAITICASLNAYASLDDQHNTTATILLRLFLFLLSSISFFILVIASKISE